MNDALDRLIREARQDLGEREAREVNWRTVDERLFARIASEKQADPARFIPGPRRPWAIAVSAALAAASVALLVVVRGPTRPVDSASSGGSESLGAVVSITGRVSCSWAACPRRGGRSCTVVRSSRRAMSRPSSSGQARPNGWPSSALAFA